MAKKQYTVSGMTCAVCAQRVEKATLKVDGVKSCSVNLISGVMKVETDKDVSEEIMNAVKSEGYGIKEGIEREEVFERQNRLKKRLTVSIPLVLLLMYVAMGSMIGLPFPNFLKEPLIFAVLQAVISLAVLVVNFAYFTVGFKNLIKLKPNMDSLVALGSSVSFLYGVFAIIMIACGNNVHTYAHNLYFEGSAMIVTLITLGKFLEEKSKNKTRSAVEKLMGLAPQTTVVIKDGKEREISVNELIEGDIFVLKDGFTVPADGEIIEGDGWADESVLTGESIPVYKEKGDGVVCGTSFSGGYALARAVSVGEDTTVRKIVKLVEDANSTKVPIAGVADKIAGIFVPAVIAISLTVLTVWLIISKDFAYSFNFAVSVLVISCPCALGLATPAALMAGTGKAAENGILIKSGEALQKSASIDTVILDKTGTVTFGKPQIEEVYPIGIDRTEFLKVCSSLESKSSHVLGKSVVSLAQTEGIGLLPVEGFETHRGQGVSGVVENKKYYLGNLSLIKEKTDGNAYATAVKITEKLTGCTLLVLATKDETLGYMSIKDGIKPTSFTAIEGLKELGITPIILTGDNDFSAKEVAEKLRVDYMANVLPEDKHREIEKLNGEGNLTMMVGDGVNDAPALSVASVGVAIGAGTDIAIDSADVVLIKSDLQDVVKTVKIGKKVMKNIKENLFWAFFYNVLLIPVASGVLSGVGIVLNPMIASAAMSLSSLFVVGNALRLRLIKFDKNKGEKEMFIKKKVGKTAIIEGMACEHCKKRVEEVFKKLGLTVEINLKKKTAVFPESEIPDGQIKSAIEEEGYTVVSIE